MSYKYKPPTGYHAGVTRRDIEQEFRRWNQQADDDVVSDWDLPLAKHGDIAAEVRFMLRGRPVVMRIDTWPDFNTNLKCVHLNIRDMRLTEARGGLEGMREALTALPAPARKRDPWEVLGVRPDADPEIVKAAYNARAKQLHPDRGGSVDAMTELNEAYEAVRQ